MRIAFYSGMRIGEIIRARRIPGALVLDDTKQGQPRIVPMHPRLRCCAHCQQVESSTTSAYFRAARSAAGMPWRHVHDLRHSAASEMINNRVGLYTVGAVLEHKSAQSTRRYAHLATDTMREQLPAWFAAVGTLAPTPAAFLQCLLLLGCRLNELLSLRWDDVNTQWRGITIGDKVEGLRVVPLTPCVHHLIAGLPRRNEYVFSSTILAQPMSYPHKQHAVACTAAGIEHLTLHGLRRSFGSLSEWLELPDGVVAQIMEHKPSATAERHYRVRPLDLLRVHHERLEAWILEQACVTFDATLEPGKLRAVATY